MIYLAWAQLADDPAALDHELGVEGWPAADALPSDPLLRPPPPTPGVPDWWTGDEQASQSFLAAMGVQL